MDALFGLPRKKSAGRSYRDPLHSNLFFSDQSEIDQYVAEYDHSKPFSNVRFQAIMFNLAVFFYTHYRIAMTFWQEMLFEVQQDTKHWMKQLYLVLLAVMNFLDFLLI